MEEPGGHHAKGNKLNTERPILGSHVWGAPRVVTFIAGGMGLPGARGQGLGKEETLFHGHRVSDEDEKGLETGAIVMQSRECT